MKFTKDQFLGNKVILKQSKEGLRATSDAVLLAALVPIEKDDTLLDVGAGNGVIGCCCYARVPCFVTAVEIQDNLCFLIQENAKLNKQEIKIVHHDIFRQPDPLKGILFHHVVSNPPFYEIGQDVRHNFEQRKAYVQDFDLQKWIDYCLKHLRSKGSFNLIHRPEMLPEILPILSQKLGNIEIFPIVSKAGEKACRILIRGYLNKKGALVLHSPLVMHTNGNQRTKIAEKILRFGGKI